MTQFWVCVGLFAVAMSVNAMLLARHLELVMETSKQRDRKYVQYRVEHPFVFWATAAASVLHFSFIQLTYSRFLGLRTLSATMRMNDIYRDAMSDYMRRRGGFTAIVQDLPQLVLQVYLALFSTNADSQVSVGTAGPRVWLLLVRARVCRRWCGPACVVAGAGPRVSSLVRARPSHFPSPSHPVSRAPPGRSSTPSWWSCSSHCPTSSPPSCPPSTASTRRCDDIVVNAVSCGVVRCCASAGPRVTAERCWRPRS